LVEDWLNNLLLRGNSTAATTLKSAVTSGLETLIADWATRTELLTGQWDLSARVQVAVALRATIFYKTP